MGFFYLLCYSVFSPGEEISFTPQETKECVHKLGEETGRGVGRKRREKESNETRSHQATSCPLSSLCSLSSLSMYQNHIEISPMAVSHSNSIYGNPAPGFPVARRSICVVDMKKGQAVYCQVTLETQLLQYPKLLSEAGIWVGMCMYVHVRASIHVRRYTHVLYFASLHT